jgi:hypothetical protein
MWTLVAGPTSLVVMKLLVSQNNHINMQVQGLRQVRLPADTYAVTG